MNRKVNRVSKILFSSKTLLLLLSLTLTLLVGWLPQRSNENVYHTQRLFDSPTDKPVDVKPPSWVRANEGRTITRGAITIVVPPGFTNQGGATVIGDIVNNPIAIELPYPLVEGTEFALGIWPSQRQNQFQNPIELRIMLHNMETLQDENLLPIFMMYDPVAKQWAELPSQFDSKSRQLSTSIRNFTPVPDNFPNWGGRTFLGVFLKREPLTPSISFPQVTLSPSQITTVKQTGNLRAGPGTTYAIVGKATPNQQIEVIARTENGEWYKLVSGVWIADILIDVVQLQSLPPTSSSISVTQGIEVATGKPVFASSYWRHPTIPNWTYSPDKVLDRQLEEVNCRVGNHTYWLLPDKQTGWIQIDLQDVFSIAGVRWLNTHNSQCNDRATTKLRIVLAQTAQFNSGTVEIYNQKLEFSTQPEYQQLLLSQPIQARYVRFYIDDYYKNGGGLNEIEVYAKTGF